MTDDDAPAGFIRATPEMLAAMRAEAFETFEAECTEFLLVDCGISAERLPAYLAEFRRRFAELYDAASAPAARRVMEQHRRDGGVVH